MSPIRFAHDRLRSALLPLVILVLLAVLALLVAPSLAMAAADTPLAGTWRGRIMQQMRLVLHIEPVATGGFAGTLDSPDQGAEGIPLGSITERGESLFVAVPSLKSEFVAQRLGADSLAGEWRQNGMRLPLGLSRREFEPRRRPQEPQGGLPYDAADVVIDTGGNGPRLAGTLTKPRGAGPHPAALLVSGSGPQDRNEEVFGHKPFLVIADHLTRQGIAVLRVDDRGIGGSTGNFGTATSDDFARDAEAGIRWLRTQKGIAPKRVGLIGHSEGGLIAPIVAGRDPELAFVVLLAGPATDGAAVIVDQTARLRRAAGMAPAVIERLSDQQRRLFAILQDDADTSGATERMRALVRESLDLLPAPEREQIGDPAAYVDQMIKAVASPWFRFFLSHDPQPALAAMRCPTLAMFGEKDIQVSPELHRVPMERALSRSGNPDASVHVLAGLNHLFQMSETGLPAEYIQIEQTIDPAALELMSGWIAKRFGAAASASPH